MNDQEKNEEAKRQERIKAEIAEEGKRRGWHRHPNDFNRQPSDEQKEAFKRGGR